MKRLESYFAEICYWLALLFLWAGSGALISLLMRLLSFDQLKWLSDRLWGVGVVYAFAAAFFISGFYFFILAFKAHARRGRLVREGPVGRIQIALWAIRGLVRQTLKQEVKDGRFHVELAQTSPQRIRIKVNAELSGQQSVVRVSEMIQRLLKERVEERTGVEVERVEVFIKGLGLAPKEREEELR
ncbi:MAG: alkaline shock response membrane anchor protein AmaP [Candidatus Bipolaricaulia bacterium]